MSDDRSETPFFPGAPGYIPGTPNHGVDIVRSNPTYNKQPKRRTTGGYAELVDLWGDRPSDKSKNEPRNKSTECGTVLNAGDTK